MFSSKLLNTQFKIAGIVCVGLCLGLSAMLLYKQDKQNLRRSLASVESYQPARLVLGKQAAAMNVEIVGPASSAEDSSELVELVGFITQNLHGDTWLDYQWSLPEGVDLIQGQVSGSLQNLTLGQPYRIAILVRGFSREKQKLITLSSQLEKAGTPLTASAVIVSRPEDTMEARVMDLASQAAKAENSFDNK